jgi:hypothetical protein
VLRRGYRELYLWHPRMYVVDIFGVQSGHRSARGLDRTAFYKYWQQRRSSSLLFKYVVSLNDTTAQPLCDPAGYSPSPPEPQRPDSVVVPTDSPAPSGSTPFVLPSPADSTSHSSPYSSKSSTKVTTSWPVSEVQTKLKAYMSEHQIRLNAACKQPYVGGKFVSLRFSCHRGTHSKGGNTAICEHHNPRKYLGRQNRTQQLQIGCAFAITIRYPFDSLPVHNPLTNEEIDYSNCRLPDLPPPVVGGAAQVVMSGAHDNHTPGSDEDTWFLPVQQVTAHHSLPLRAPSRSLPPCDVCMPHRKGMMCLCA